MKCQAHCRNLITEALADGKVPEVLGDDPAVLTDG